MHFSPFLVMVSTLPIASLVSVAIYVFRSLGLYSMAENTGVPHPWLAWVPLANLYLLGRLADRYSGAALGRQTYYRIIMPVVQGGGAVLLATAGTTWVIGLAFSHFAGFSAGEALGLVGIMFFALLLAAANAVVTVLCCYKVFLDYEPTSAVGYTVLALFGLEWIPLFLCRNNVPTGVAGHCTPKQPRYQVGNRRL